MFHFSIGVDDVCLSLYLDKGLLAVYNRWVLFFLNRILHLNILSWPYQITEAIAILLMVVAAYVWCASFEKVICTGNVSLNPWICGLASALFISCPILSELWVYYLHNGVSIGYLVTGCSVYLFLTTFAKENTHKFSKLVICGILLAVGMGCYETMIECFIVVVILLFMILRAYKDNDTYDVRFYKWIVFGTVVFAISLAIRKGITELFKYIVDYSSFDQYKPAIYRPMFGDVFSAPGLLGMIIKRFFIRYYVNAVVYLPILFLVILWAILGIFAIKYFLKKKDILIIVCVPVMMLCPIAMSIVCGSTELYRSAQYIPLLIMSGAFVVYSEIKKEYKNDKLPCLLLYSAIFAGGVAQIIGTNKWLINDYHKFVEVKSIMTDIAESINDSTNKGKPVVVLGAIPPSDKIQKEACVSYDSWQYRVISLMTDWMDPTLKEKYHNYYDNSLGYYFVESPLLSVLNWAGGAFPDEEGRAHEQFTELWSLLGYEGITYADQQTEDMAREIWIDKKMVGYPEEGYIYEDDNVIIISLSQY